MTWVNQILVPSKAGEEVMLPSDESTLTLLPGCLASRLGAEKGLEKLLDASTGPKGVGTST